MSATVVTVVVIFFVADVMVLSLSGTPRTHDILATFSDYFQLYLYELCM